MTRLFKVSVNGREYDVSVLEVTPGAAPSALWLWRVPPARPLPQPVPLLPAMRWRRWVG